MYNLRRECRELLLNEVFDPMKTRREWKVLLVDRISLKVLSTCCTTEEVLRQNISYIEMIDETRDESLFEAIYVLYPMLESVEKLIEDFQHGRKNFFCAHVFFLTNISREIFELISEASVAGYIKTLKELNLAILPYESRVFSLDDPEVFRIIYNKEKMLGFRACDELAERITTLFATLKLYPIVRYRKNLNCNRKLAEAVKTKIDEHCTRFPSENMEKNCHFLIIDRGVDCTTPLLHELTLQALVHDVLPVQLNTYKCGTFTTAIGNVIDRDIALDENDEFWLHYRHKHIASVANIVSEVLQKYKLERSENPEKQKKSDLRRLSREVNNIIKLRLKRKYSDYRHMVAECVERFSSRLKELCALEQDLAMRCTEKFAPIRDPSLRVAEILLNEMYTHEEKLRVLILYIFYWGGVAEGYLAQLIKEAGLTMEDFQTITNLENLGCCIIKTIKTPTTDNIIRKDRRNEMFYKVSRWTPVLKDIIELYIDGQLDAHSFPYLSASHSMSVPDIKFELEDTFEDERQKSCYASREIKTLVIFVLGGISYSEIRCAYEVSSLYSDWDIIIGSDHILTPNAFLEDVHSLSLQNT